MRTRMVIATGLLLIATITGCSSKPADDDVATAGGASARPSTGGGANGLDQQELAAKFGQCMRDNGIADFPDPKVNANGGVSLDVPQGADPQKVVAAQDKCKQWAPGGGEPTKLDPERIEQLRKLSECMRDHGVKNFPDPTDEGIQANGNDSGMNPDDPTFKAAMLECSKYQPSAAADDGGAGTSHGGN